MRDAAITIIIVVLGLLLSIVLFGQPANGADRWPVIRPRIVLWPRINAPVVSPDVGHILPTSPDGTGSESRTAPNVNALSDVAEHSLPVPRVSSSCANGQCSRPTTRRVFSWGTWRRAY
jgi:hypothetical protein